MWKKVIFLFLILSLLITLIGCGGGNPIIPPMPDQEPLEPIIPETTKVVEEETIREIVSVAEDQSTIVFEKSTPQLEELTPGDIIAMGVTENTPVGLLRKITKVTKGGKDSSEVVVETEFATLEEAIEQGEFNFNIPLQIKNMKEPFSCIEGVKLITDQSKLKDFSHEFNYEINLIAYDEDGNPNTIEDNIYTTGFIFFDYNIIFNGEIKSYKLENFVFKNILELETDISISGGSSITLDIIGKSLLPKPIELGTYTIMLGPIPVVLSPSIDIKWGLNGALYGALSVGVTRTDTFTAGLEWDNGTTQPIADHSTSYEYNAPSTSLGGQIKYSIGPELSCKIYKVLGPYCDSSLYAKLSADVLGDPWWNLVGGIDAGVGAKLKIFTKTYIDVSLTVIDFSISIAQADGPFGGNNHSPIISDLSADPPSVNINQTTTITCTASDEDVGDTLTYSWAKTGGTFEGSTSGSTITWKAPSTKGNYTVSCEVSDGEASVSDQVIISVGDVNHPPQIVSTPVTSATKGQPYSYDVNATDSDGDIPVYSLTTKPSGMTINSSTGLIAWTPTATGSFGVTVKVSDGELFDTQSFTITVESTTTTDKPDLMVSNIWTEPNPPIAAGFTTIGIEIKNQGNADTIKTFFLEFYFDGTYQGHVYINGLTAGSTNTSYWQAVTWPSDTNLHTIKGVVDPDNAIIESNESNNQYSIQVKATEPPVGIGTLKIESVPGIAKVYIDGVYKGETPSSGYLTISNLSTGDHNLKVTKTGYTDWIGIVTIPSGSTQYKAVILESITTKPDAPTSLSPGTTSAPGPYINTLTPTLQWQAVSNADYSLWHK